MSYTPANTVEYGHCISTLGPHSLLTRPVGNVPNANAWPSANVAVYLPVGIRRAVTVLKLGIVNGTSVSGNFDIGIYNASGTRLVSTGSTAQSGTSTEQVVDVTDTTLTPGPYYFALVLDNGTGMVRTFAPSVPVAAAWGALSQSSAFTLPATATFARSTVTTAPLILAFVEATVA